MLTVAEIGELLKALDGELSSRNVVGEVGLCGFQETNVAGRFIKDGAGEFVP